MAGTDDRQARDRLHARLWALAGRDPEFRAEMSRLWEDFADDDRGAWEAGADHVAVDRSAALSSFLVGIDARALDAGRTYRFQLRLTLGTIAPVAPASSVRELEATVRHSGEQLSRRAERVADVLLRLGERGWRPLSSAPAGREVLAGRGFAGPDGSALPEAVAVVKDAAPAEVARDLAGGELAEGLTVRIEDLDLPVVLTANSAELRYSPREYLDTFSIRG